MLMRDEFICRTYVCLLYTEELRRIVARWTRWIHGSRERLQIIRTKGLRISLTRQRQYILESAKSDRYS